MRDAAGQFPADGSGDSVKAYIQALYNRKFVSDFSVEMSRSARKWLDIWTKGE